jgi:hypothetical protein
MRDQRMPIGPAGPSGGDRRLDRPSSSSRTAAAQRMRAGTAQRNSPGRRPGAFAYAYQHATNAGAAALLGSPASDRGKAGWTRPFKAKNALSAIRNLSRPGVKAFRVHSLGGQRHPLGWSTPNGLSARLTEPADDHSDDACSHRQGRRPTEYPQPAGDRELAHDPRLRRHQHHHRHDWHGNDPIDHGRPV